MLLKNPSLLPDWETIFASEVGLHDPASRIRALLGQMP